MYDFEIRTWIQVQSWLTTGIPPTFDVNENALTKDGKALYKC